METRIRECCFTSAESYDEKLAIQTCPGYDEALQRAVDDPWEEKRLRYSCKALKERNQRFNETTKRGRKWPDLKIASCPVTLCFTPYVSQLIIRGKCLME
ncbi:hypothetical protein HYU95_03230 [Candidatus Daviesbacteria bacterium]|nr:hypothetical protein [Candidatus Daviesbacteria bacterium]